jgi:hypothetical protein
VNADYRDSNELPALSFARSSAKVRQDLTILTTGAGAPSDESSEAETLHLLTQSQFANFPTINGDQKDSARELRSISAWSLDAIRRRHREQQSCRRSFETTARQHALALAVAVRVR